MIEKGQNVAKSVSKSTFRSRFLGGLSEKVSKKEPNHGGDKKDVLGASYRSKPESLGKVGLSGNPRPDRCASIMSYAVMYVNAVTVDQITFRAPS